MRSGPKLTASFTDSACQMQNPSFVLEKAGAVRFEDRAVPELKGDHDVLVNIKQTGICGSDVRLMTLVLNTD